MIHFKCSNKIFIIIDDHQRGTNSLTEWTKDDKIIHFHITIKADKHTYEKIIPLNSNMSISLFIDNKKTGSLPSRIERMLKKAVNSGNRTKLIEHVQERLRYFKYQPIEGCNLIMLNKNSGQMEGCKPERECTICDILRQHLHLENGYKYKKDHSLLMYASSLIKLDPCTIFELRNDELVIHFIHIPLVGVNRTIQDRWDRIITDNFDDLKSAKDVDDLALKLRGIAIIGIGEKSIWSTAHQLLENVFFIDKDA